MSTKSTKSTKIKYTEKELKQPDEFNKTIARIIDFTADHAKKILIAVVIIIVVLVGAFFINSSSHQSEIEANNMFDEAVGKFYDGDLDGALAGFLETEKNYPDQGVSNIALYYAALVNYNNENYEESINILNQFEADELGEPMLTDSAILIQGLAYFNQNEWQKSIDYLSRIVETSSPYENQAKLHMAISYEKLGDEDRANAIYYQLNQSSPDRDPGLSSVSE